ncbi:MAG: DUF5694 domain-containing protein [Bacteroidota bacterium]
MNTLKTVFAAGITSILLLSACQPKAETTRKTVVAPSVWDTIKRPNDFYPSDRAKVLVVGTFHFQYPGLDTHKTSKEDQVDVLKEPKKSELEDLVAYIKKFHPNKIAIEARPKWNTMEKYVQYQNGEHSDKRDERYTLGMRIAKDLELDTLYAIDATSLFYDLQKKDSTLLNSLIDQIDWNASDPYWDMAKKWLNYDDKLVPKMHLLDYFKYLNGRENHLANYGLYLTGNMGKIENQAADNLSLWWYNRNLRIFSKLVGISEGPRDRILVIMGNGHASLLRHLFESSPQFEFVEFDSL